MCHIEIILCLSVCVCAEGVCNIDDLQMTVLSTISTIYSLSPFESHPKKKDDNDDLGGHDDDNNDNNVHD